MKRRSSKRRCSRLSLKPSCPKRWIIVDDGSTDRTAEIGGYVPNPAGGIDWIAVMTARTKGWQIKSFPEKRYYHHRRCGTAGRSTFAGSFSYGEKDYYLGNSPLWQFFRVAYRMTKKPFVMGGLALLSGYIWVSLRRVECAVPRS
jgi:hypothetical protein